MTLSFTLRRESVVFQIRHHPNLILVVRTCCMLMFAVSFRLVRSLLDFSRLFWPFCNCFSRLTSGPTSDCDPTSRGLDELSLEPFSTSQYLVHPVRLRLGAIVVSGACVRARWRKSRAVDRSFYRFVFGRIGDTGHRGWGGSEIFQHVA